MRTIVRLFILSMLFILSACSLPGARKQAISYYVLEPALPSVASTVLPAGTIKPVLLVRDAEPDAFTQNLSLVYSRAPGTQAHYQYAFWTVVPAKRLSLLLRERLLSSGLYAGVVPLSAGVQGDYQLNFRLLDFFHDAARSPGAAQVKLEVELIERGRARLIAQRTFAARVELPSQDAAAAAAGLGQASARVLEAVVVWLAGVQPYAVDSTLAR